MNLMKMNMRYNKVMDTLQLFSIIIEAVVVFMLLYGAIYKGAVCAYGMALTFAIYVFYDLVKFFNLGISESILTPAFFVASLSALWAVWKMSRE